MSQCIQKLDKSNMHNTSEILLATGLFGESTQLPDVMHCETIAARSSLHDWELSPHRHARLHQVMLVQSGSGTAYLEGTPLSFTDHSLVNVPPGAVHAFRFAPDTEGFVVTLADEILDLILAGTGDMRHTLAQAAVCEPHADVAAVMERIWREFNGLASARALVLRGLCTTLLGLTARQLALTAPSPAAQGSTQVLQRFEALVEAHFLSHWSVADYAQAMSISPTHLSRVVRAATGAPASHWIDARVIREARRRLAYTNLRVATVADALGFADPAYFSRMFTRATGVSPRAFRSQLMQPRNSAPAKQNP